MEDLKDYLPLQLLIFKGDDDQGDGIVMGEITDRGEITEIAFDWNGRRYYVRAKSADLRAALPQDDSHD